jgi:hypothetical protein
VNSTPSLLEAFCHLPDQSLLDIPTRLLLNFPGQQLRIHLNPELLHYVYPAAIQIFAWPCQVHDKQNNFLTELVEYGD